MAVRWTVVLGKFRITDFAIVESLHNPEAIVAAGRVADGQSSSIITHFVTRNMAQIMARVLITAR